jgi:hypothetical protein
MATDEGLAVEALKTADEVSRDLCAASADGAGQWRLLYHLGVAVVYALFNLGDCVQDLTSEVRSAGGRL